MVIAKIAGIVTLVAVILGLTGGEDGDDYY